MGLWLDRGRECDNLHQAIEIQIIQYLCGTDSPVSVALNTPLDRPIDRALRGFFIRFCYPSVTRPPKWRLLVTNKPIYHSELQPILERSNRFCFGIHIENTRLAYSPYLSYYVASTPFRKFIYPFAQGSTRFNLCKADFEKASIKLPSLENQKHIYAVLSRITEKTETERTLLRHYTTQKQYLLRQMFI